MKKIIAALLLGTIAITGCQTAATAAATTASKPELGSKENPVKLGVVGANTDVWDDVITRLNAKGIYIDITKFTDYNLPNDALVAGDINLNAFQHQKFLGNYNAEKKQNLTVVAKTVIAPLAIYSEKIRELSEIKEGDTISIPNDPSNGGRALVLLQTAGLVKLRADAPANPIKSDIVENKLNLKIEELDAAQTARSLKDVTAAVINSGMAVDAGLQLDDSVFSEPVNESSEPYINVIVSKPEDKDLAVFQKIVAEYQTDRTAEVIKETSKGGSIPAWK